MDFVSYIMGLITGKREGAKTVTLDGDGYSFADSNNDGNVVITEVAANG